MSLKLKAEIGFRPGEPGTAPACPGPEGLNTGLNLHSGFLFPGSAWCARQNPLPKSGTATFQKY
jgi:hypothetical protein